MSQDTGKYRTNTKDQFYTSPAIAAQCVARLLELVPDANTYRWIEPSAGGGAFVQAAPVPVLALDIEPRAEGIQQADFLTWQPTPTQQPTLLFGNPPFGRQSTLAKSFIRKGCKIATVIAFILPKSFQKDSMMSAFDPHFHCLHSEELPTNAFLCNGTPYDVPCVFQVWQRREDARPPAEKVEAHGFVYVKAGEDYDIAFRRVGALAGKGHLAGGTYSPQSHYFWKLEDVYRPHIATIVARLNAHTFPSNTVGPRSLSKTEANRVMNAILSSLS